MFQHGEGHRCVELSITKGQVLSLDETESHTHEMSFQVGAILNAARRESLAMGIPSLKEIVVRNVKVRCRPYVQDAALRRRAEQSHDSLIHSSPHPERHPCFQIMKGMIPVEVINAHRVPLCPLGSSRPPSLCTSRVLRYARRSSTLWKMTRIPQVISSCAPTKNAVAPVMI